jgi:F-type H+-transporting ATPase subunit delta
VSQTLKKNPELRDALSNPSRSVGDRSELVDTVFGGKALPATVTLVKQALAGTYRTVDAALAVYREVAAETAGERVATIRVAEPLSDADRTRLQAALAKQYGRDIHVNEVVDPDVIGGIRIELGDDVIDGTVSNRLDDARRRLVG